MDGLLDEMPSHVFAEWMVYYNLEPFGEEVTDVHLANLTALIANQNRGKKQKSYKAEDLRTWKQVKRKFDPGEFYENLKGFLTRK